MPKAFFFVPSHREIIYICAAPHKKMGYSSAGGTLKSI